jgi:hypothetical protein
MSDQEFINKSLELYEKYNENRLIYNDFPRYNKLITADPLLLSEAEFAVIKSRGQSLVKWLAETNNIYRVMQHDKGLQWFKDILAQELSPKALDYQFQIANKFDVRTHIMRADLSSLPFGCHEAQLRWGIVGHAHYINSIFDSTIKLEEGQSNINNSLADEIQKVIDHYCVEDNECCIFLSPQKYIQETTHFGKLLNKNIVIKVGDFNESNFVIKSNQLYYRATGQKVRIVFRRELTLETLSETDFGEEVIQSYLAQEVSFEPGLNLINDSKFGMALAFDDRTKHFYSDESREIFLPTSLYDDEFKSFNSVFGTNYSGLGDYLDRTTPSQRKHIYKFGGFNLKMSFGSAEVYRMDRTESTVRKVLAESKAAVDTSNSWIMQEFDPHRFNVRYLKGDYEKPETCEIGVSENSSARIMVFYSHWDSKVDFINISANFVNDHWKARFKSSDQINGKGAVVTSARLQLATTNIK